MLTICIFLLFRFSWLIASLFSYFFIWITLSCQRIRRLWTRTGLFRSFTAKILFSLLMFCFSLTRKFGNSFCNRFFLNNLGNIFEFRVFKRKFFDSSFKITRIKVNWIKSRRMTDGFMMRNAVYFWIFVGFAFLHGLKLRFQSHDLPLKVA